MKRYRSSFFFKEQGDTSPFLSSIPLFEVQLNFLPPPKTNRYLQTKTGKRFIPARIKNAIDDAIHLLSQFAPKKPINEPCQLYVIYTLPNKRKRDLDNLNKTLQDCLEKAGVVKDDTLFFRTISEKQIIPKEERVEIKIFPINSKIILPPLVLP